MRVFVDFHHSSLLRSLILLLEDRLGMNVYRPIGMDWFYNGFWAINDQEDTARQFLSTDQAIRPGDGTPPLNKIQNLHQAIEGLYYVLDPGSKTAHKACDLSLFQNTKFDYLIATIPQHVPIFKKLIELYQPQAKLIIQIGNNWQGYDFGDTPVLASVKGPLPNATNAIFYHQEFDLEIFHPETIRNSKNVYSFVNIIQNTGKGWDDYLQLKHALGPLGWKFRAYGGQCPDGNMTGPYELANKLREAMFVFHVKPGGDGFGHIIHNAYAVGRPLITRSSYYRGQLAEDLLVEGTYIDLDVHPLRDVQSLLMNAAASTMAMQQMSQRAYARFCEVVNYDKEAKAIESWLQKI